MNRPTTRSATLTLDRINECVRRGDREIKLTPKAFAVLRLLMERPGRLATKDELLGAIWPDTAVTDGSLATSVREIRRALDDDPSAPRYIQTVHRRGYRYVGTTDRAEGAVDASRPQLPGGRLVGRETELA